MPTLSFKKLAPLTRPDWALELISTDLGTAAFAGTYRDRNYLVLGFEIFPYQGRKSPVLSILTLNILKWLSGESLADSSLSVFDRITSVQDINEVLYLDSPGAEIRTVEQTALQSDNEQFFPNSPGLLLIKSKKANPLYRAVNFFNDSESNLLINSALDIPDPDGAFVSTRDKQLLTKGIVLLALILMLLDMILASRSRILQRQAQAGGS